MAEYNTRYSVENAQGEVEKQVTFFNTAFAEETMTHVVNRFKGYILNISKLESGEISCKAWYKNDPLSRSKTYDSEAEFLDFMLAK